MTLASLHSIKARIRPHYIVHDRGQKVSGPHSTFSFVQNLLAFWGPILDIISTSHVQPSGPTYPDHSNSDIIITDILL
jgi:hypothetical protein